MSRQGSSQLSPLRVRPRGWWRGVWFYFSRPDLRSEVGQQQSSRPAGVQAYLACAYRPQLFRSRTLLDSLLTLCQPGCHIISKGRSVSQKGVCYPSGQTALFLGHLKTRIHAGFQWLLQTRACFPQQCVLLTLSPGSRAWSAHQILE